MFEYYEVDAKQIKTSVNGNIKEHSHLKINYEDGALKIKYENFGELVTLDGSVYKAQEIVFHSPAEHAIDGKHYDLEVQIIHYGQTKDDIAKQAVLCFLFEKRPGVYNKFLDDVDFFNLPNPIHKEKNIENNLYIPKLFYDADNKDVAVMKDFSFYTYQGSLTASPCTENTIMYVTAKPIPLGNTAIQLFQEALRMPDLVDTKGNIKISTMTPSSSRILQKRNGRQVYYYAAKKECHESFNGKPLKVQGHYEAIPKTINQYLYVSGPQPSGMPGAMVVSRNEAVHGGII